MSIGLGKIAFLGAAGVSAGGITAGSFLVPSSEKTLDSKSGLNPAPKSNSESVPKTKKCIVLVTDLPQEISGSNPKITKILQQFKNSEQFLQDKEGTFKTDVQEACAERKDGVHKTEDEVHVYKQNNGSWNYTVRLQRNWLGENIGIEQVVER
ncbi:hypothetical protein MHF_1165 [Mycoplasma haemofelis Ohio2]|uniref:Uncharacterized protein n=1 Tax=Mycoplasma haemofelis (strain Ohio2) TaxID=859194 RepID=F6FJQ1_MYCHI|nr:hypothetical protein MHF_1165 [Mycoplasma haemofelis Ohio2]